MHRMRARRLVLTSVVMLLSGCGDGNSAPAPPPMTTSAAPTTLSQQQQLATLEAELKTALVTECHELVKARLKAPLTAVFDEPVVDRITGTESEYTIAGAMHSSNLMGVPLGATYKCTSSTNAQGKHDMVSTLTPD